MRSIGRAMLAVVAVMSLSGPAIAQITTKPVVELFTSQGCSSCPPADRLLGELAKRDDLIALTFNVDYWDYLGWRDTLGKPEYSQRQRTYALTRGDGAVYTPQLVLNGRYHLVGSDRRKIARALRRIRSHGSVPPARLSVIQKGGMVIIRVEKAERRLRKNATVFVAGIVPKITVPIRRGENRGRKITYHNVVKKLMPVGTWTGEATEIRVDPAMIMGGKITSCAVLVQAGDAGPIHAAAWLDR
ncbi:MAG: DUF1223 domain-containing protein [Pseudomonadota bacterium]